MSITEKDQQYIWHPFTQMKTAEQPLAIVKGKGTLLFDEEENSYIDAIASWWVNLHGHAHPYLAQKVNEQMQTLEHVVFAGFTHEPATTLCERLSKRLPSKQQKFFFSGDGSSAVEIALKMSIQFWKNKGEKRHRFLALDGGYHGETFGAMSAGARSIFSAPFTDYLFEVTHLPFPKDEGATLIALQNELQKGKVAAFIFEPLVQGAAGMHMYSPSTLDKMIALCQEHNVLCIADEVMTGFGRTGTYFACNQLQQQPDFICLSKGLSGGTLPLSLTTCTQAIYDAFLGNDISTAFLHGHSFTGNPVGCASAIASLDLLEDETCQHSIERISQRHADFAKALTNNPLLEDIRQTGTILAIELKTDTSGYASNLRTSLYQQFISEGVLLRPLGNVIYILPPYCITDEELEKVYKSIVSVLEKMAN
jgi:adenosylmethionine---8-amino-7-oxononanoate aminotransferase